MSVITRKDRFSYAPVLKRDGTTVVITEDDLEEGLYRSILDQLREFRLLAADYIAPLAGTSYGWACPLINELKSEPNRYIDICDEQYENKKNHYYNPLQLELSPKAIRFYEHRGYRIPARKPVRRLRHQIMEDQIRASLVIGAKEYEDRIRIIWRETLLKSPRMPTPTRTTALPERIEVNGQEIWPDGKMFVVVNKITGGSFFVHGYEADTGTESIDTVIRAKFAGYISLIKHRLYAKKYGADNYFIPFIFHNTNRRDHAMQVLTEEVKHEGHLAEHFLFKVHPLYNESPKPRATGHMIAEPFLRVGGEPFNFLEA